MIRGIASPAQWRFASRLARREVRRRPGRTLLVVLLIAIPIMVMTGASVLARTYQDGGHEFEVRYGDATDAVVTTPVGSDLASQEPGSTINGATVVGVTNTTDAPLYRAGESVGGRSWTDITDASVGDGSRFSVSEGREPVSGEVWISDPLLDGLGLDVGDTLTLDHPAGSWEIVGSGRDRSQFDEPVLAGPDFPTDDMRAGYGHAVVAVDLPSSDGPVRERDVRTMLGLGNGVSLDYHPDVEPENRGWSSYGSQVSGEELAWGWAASAIGLGLVGIIIAAAFAASGRRQLVTIGQLSANGASPPLVRRTLALQGMWTGALGAACGIAAAAVPLAFGRGVIERIHGSTLGAYRLVPFDLIVILLAGTVAATLAALVPAWSASRVSTLTALSGRRPVVKVRRRLVPIGVAFFAVGLFLLVLAAAIGVRRAGGPEGAQPQAIAAVAGGLSVAVGMCCASPKAIDVMGRITSRIGRSWRFAGRSLARTRARSAAVATAIGIACAAAIAGSAAVAAHVDPSSDWMDLPSDAVVLATNADWGTRARGETVDLPMPHSMEAPESVVSEVESLLPNGEWFERREAVYDPVPMAFSAKRRPERPAMWDKMRYGTIVVADAAVIDLYQLSDHDRAQLDEYGALDTGSNGRHAHRPDAPPRTMTFAAEDGDIEVTAGRRLDPFDGSGELRRRADAPFVQGDWATRLLITEEKAKELGFEIITVGEIVRNDHWLTPGERDQLNSIGRDNYVRESEFYDVPRTPESSMWQAHTDWRDKPVSDELLQSAIVAAALLLTLMVVAIGLTLSAAESRDETDVLVAVGAKPSTRGRMAAVKAVVITLTAALLALPTGLVPVAVVSRAADESFVMPWVAVLGVVVVVPAIAGGAAWLTSAIARRVRRESMTQLAFE